MRTIDPGRVARLPVHRHPGRHLDVPLLHDADVGAHRQRHVRRRRDRPAGPAAGRPRATCSSSPSSTSGAQGGTVDADKVDAEQPDAVVFNGYANQYDHRPLTGRGRRAGPGLGARRRTEPARRRSTSSAASSTRCTPRGRTCCGAADGGSQVLALRAGPGRLRRADLPEAGRLPVRLARDGRRRARRPRDLRRDLAPTE